MPGPLVMQSSGGVTDAERAAAGGAWSVLSGPAGGAVGAGLLAAASGSGDALGLDMGGTSCDVCVVAGGRVGRTEAREFDRRPIQLPMVDVHTVGAGGGSIAWRDGGGALRVGPRSAGAEPGPACYGRGGTEPTVTDANLMLGYLDPEGGLAGGVALDRPAAEAAVGALADALGLGQIEAAAGIPRSPTTRCSGRCGSSPSSAGSIRAGSTCCRSAAPDRCMPPRSQPSSASSGSSARARAGFSPRSGSSAPSAAATRRAR